MQKKMILSQDNLTKLYDALTCPKKYTLFTIDEGAEEHCQSGAPSLSNQRIFD